jgi:molecular chaperone DnaK
MEKLLKENRDKLGADTATSLESAVKQLESVRSGNDKAAIESAMSALEQASHKAAEEMYRNSGGQAGQGAAPGAGPNPDAPGSQATPKKDDVVDAEFRTN